MSPLSRSTRQIHVDSHPTTTLYHPSDAHGTPVASHHALCRVDCGNGSMGNCRVVDRHGSDSGLLYRFNDHVALSPSMRISRLVLSTIRSPIQRMEINGSRFRMWGNGIVFFSIWDIMPSITRNLDWPGDDCRPRTPNFTSVNVVETFHHC